MQRYGSTVPAMAWCLSVSVVSQCSVETYGWIKLVFGMKAFFDFSYTVF